MAGALLAALAAPIREVQALVGPGWSAVPELSAARTALADVAAGARRAWSGIEAGWSGGAAEAAAAFVATTAAAAEALANRIDEMGVTAQSAGEAVARARARLQDIVEEFDARAAALEPHLKSPDVVAALMAEARRSLEEAVAVVEELRAELDGHSAQLGAPAAPPASTTPAGMPSMGSGFGGGAPTSPPSTIGATHGSGLADFARFSPPQAPVPDAPLPDAAAFGDGIAVRLPDGSTSTAPNAVAASAVRYALTQLGVPYQWGGTTPGVGLDCSGLTQWAYHEAGLDLPRLAQEQDVGAPVNPGSLRPGDLAVWDGHVAMIVGNGTMIEAGDPVKLSPIRTDNAGQGFQGFWRPTA
jgi:cell wall-associated NlpC family hydrolase